MCEPLSWRLNSKNANVDNRVPAYCTAFPRANELIPSSVNSIPDIRSRIPDNGIPFPVTRNRVPDNDNAFSDNSRLRRPLHLRNSPLGASTVAEEDKSDGRETRVSPL